MSEVRWYLLFVKNMSSLEISSFCFNQETKLPLSLPLVEGSTFEPPGYVREFFFLTSVVEQDHTDNNLYIVYFILFVRLPAPALYWCRWTYKCLSSLQLNVILVCSLYWFNMIQLSFYFVLGTVPDTGVLIFLFCRRENWNSKKLKNLSWSYDNKWQSQHFKSDYWTFWVVFHK